MKTESIGIGLMGLGVVGSQVAESLLSKSDFIAEQTGCPLSLKRVLVRDLAKKRSPNIPPALLTDDPLKVLDDADIDIIVELIGGETAAHDYIKQAISRGKHVATANKEVIAKHGPELHALAAEYGVSIRHEASVGGGIPVIGPFKQDLLANRIAAIHAIINGTTNYIVTRMANDGLDFETALRQAQELGYAEADPANDIDGVDAAYKLAILATLAFRTEVRPDDVYREGISRLAPRDFRYARELGYAIKLLAIGKEEQGSVQVRVHPAFIPSDLLLAEVDGVFNAVEVEGDLTGRVIFYGRGAGPFPTTSAVISDVIQLARDIQLGVAARQQPRVYRRKPITPMSQIETRYYMRMTIADQAGVLAQISKILGDQSISIASVIQKEADERAQTAEIVIMTHPARESAVRQALLDIENLRPIVQEVGNLIRVED
jgi:homoserine dehydrogenase